MTPNKTLIFKKIPITLPVPGEHLVIESHEIDLDNAPRGVFLSEFFMPHMTLTWVLKSDNSDFQEGDIIKARAPIAEYAAITDPKAQSVIKVQNPYNLDLALFTGALGMPGLTAWASLYKIGQPKKGETMFISSAAGAVGQFVGQIAKKEGLTVIGSIRSDEKLDYITKELGLDAGFNYKKEKPSDAMKRLAPHGIDIYYENVGGEHLEAALDNMNVFGRIAASGMISQYNGDKFGIRNLMQVVAKQLNIQGFIVFTPAFGPAYYITEVAS
ncbi:hypothetical protein TrVGV298_004800 [Trichoderma virens]|nr:hypothetical protein TrVGV298_004800 [Trichoderma virens]